MKDIIYKWTVLFVVVVPLLALFYGMYLLWNRAVDIGDVALMLTFYLLTGLGITLGYHRMLTHKSFECVDWLRGFILILGCMAFEGPPIQWAGTHIKHHAHSDEEDDPHSPLEGFWHAHFGWFMNRAATDRTKYASHLLEDPVVVFVDKHQYVWMGLSLLLPALIGGWSGFLWGGLVRISVVHHLTWSVNSICHTFGKRSFITTDQSRNNWLIGLLGFGEGWHNNHHAFPTNAYHGMRWWQFDLSGLLIRGLERCGLVWDIQSVSREAERAHMIRQKNMMDALYEMRLDLLRKVDSAKMDLDAMYSALPKAQFPKPMRKQVKRMRKRYEKRLERIKYFATANDTAKKQALNRYKAEVTELIEDAKIKFRQEVKMFSKA